jgi:hypothetical protein
MDDAEGAEGGADGAFAACSADSIEGAGRSANTTSNLTTNLDICRTISSALIPAFPKFVVRSRTSLMRMSNPPHRHFG